MLLKLYGDNDHVSQSWCITLYSNVEEIIQLCSSFLRFRIIFLWFWRFTQR